MSDQVYVFDIDSTLADNEHRVHFLHGEEKDWDSFFAAQGDDGPIEGTIQLAQALYDAGYVIVLCTGRMAQYREVTEQWLDKYDIKYDMLLMRPNGDFRGDDVIKAELLEEHLSGYEVAGIFEDRKRVVDALRKEGYQVYHVADGDY